jgi:hypothetical protein
MYRMVSVTINTFKTWTWNAIEYSPPCQLRINLNVYVAIRNSTWYINEYYSVRTLLLLTLLSVPVSYISSKLSLSLWIFHIHITSNTTMTSHHCVRCAVTNCCHYAQYHCSYRTLISHWICFPTKANIYSAVIWELPKICSATEARKKLLLVSGATQTNSSLNTPTVFVTYDNWQQLEKCLEHKSSADWPRQI